MKKNCGIRRAGALFLALAMCLSLPAGASFALGHDLHTDVVELSEGTELTRQRFWSDTYWDLRTEQYLTYVPNADVVPTVAYGGDICARATLTEMALALEEQGKHVVGGVNGDFYVMSTGAPIGMVITDGVLRSSPGYGDSWYYAVGFRADGTVLLGRPELTATATLPGGVTVRLDGGVNKVRAAGKGYFLFTEDFGDTTKNLEPGVDVVLEPVLEGIGDTVTVDLRITDPTTGWVVIPTPVPTQTPAPTPEPTETPGEDGGAPEPTEAPGEDGGAPEPVPEPAETPVPSPAAPAASPTEAPTAPPTIPEDEISESTDLTGVEPPADQPLPTVVRRIISDQTVSGSLRVNGRVRCIVREVTEAENAAAIQPGTMVLSVNGRDDPALLTLLRGLEPGDEVDLDVTCPDPAWAEVREALGAMHQLVKDGQVQEGLNNDRTARTAVGVKADGSVVFYTIDGRQTGYSVGATLEQVAARLVELGCVEALGLDGGGSTTLGAVYPGDGALTVVNRPADGGQRANSVAVFLTTELEPTGELGHLYITPSGPLLLAGASVQLEAQALDTAYYPMAAEGQPGFYIESGGGAITPGGLFTAGNEREEVRVAAALDGAEGRALVTVIAVPERISLTNELTGAAVTALRMDPGDTVDLRASAVWRKLPMTCQDACFTWTTAGDVGTVDENGVFIAGQRSGTGSVTAAVNGVSVTVPVTVRGRISAVEGFEGGVDALTGSSSVTASLQREGGPVRYGSAAARLDYDMGDTGTAVLAADLTIPADARYLSAWVYGDGSDNTLSAVPVDNSGRASTLLLTVLDFIGWRQVTVELPAGTASIAALYLVSGGETAAGTIWLDQLTATDVGRTDVTPPTAVITVGLSGISARITDDMDRTLPESRVALLYDGAPLDFTWQAGTGTLTAALPELSGGLHRVTVTAEDASGNLGRVSMDIGDGQTGTVLADMKGHWAAGTVGRLYDLGAVSGIQTEAGPAFRPNDRLSRGDFLLMTAKWLGLDLEAYRDTALPFPDAEDIPAWDVDGVKAMYALGYLADVLDGPDAALRAAEPVTRAEVMTILARTQPRGCGAAELTFSDAEQTPAWALEAIQSLVYQGIVSGSGGTLRPNDPITRAEAAKLLYSMM